MITKPKKTETIQNTNQKTHVLLDYRQNKAKNYAVTKENNNLTIHSIDTNEVNHIYQLPRTPKTINHTYSNGLLEVTIQWN